MVSEIPLVPKLCLGTRRLEALLRGCEPGAASGSARSSFRRSRASWPCVPKQSLGTRGDLSPLSERGEKNQRSRRRFVPLFVEAQMHRQGLLHDQDHQEDQVQPRPRRQIVFLFLLLVFLDGQG